MRLFYEFDHYAQAKSVPAMRNIFYEFDQYAQAQILTSAQIV